MVDQKKYTIHPDKYGERFQQEIEARLKAHESAKKPAFRPSEDPELLRQLFQKGKPVASFDSDKQQLRATRDRKSQVSEPAQGFCPMRFLNKLFSGLFNCCKK